MKGSMKNGHGFVCTLPGKYHGWESLGLIMDSSERNNDWILSTGRKKGKVDCDKIQTPRIGCGKSLGKKDELVVCEEVARFLQRTYYERLTLYGMWHKGMASRSRRWATGNKSKANRRSTTRSRSPTGQ